MRIWQWAAALSIAATAGCGSQGLTAARSAAVDEGVRAFARTVAHDVTQEGPLAWRKHFAEAPSFFMAVNGRLVFSDSASFQKAIPDVARSIPRIELQWGDGSRVDPLAPDLAVFAAPYHEVQVRGDGTRVDDDGYFTGIAENRGGRWQFRKCSLVFRGQGAVTAGGRDSTLGSAIRAAPYTSSEMTLAAFCS